KPEARQCPRHEMVMQRLIAAQGLQRQLALAESKEKRMPLGVPALADWEYPLGDRDVRSEIAVACHSRYLPRRDHLGQHSGRRRRRKRGDGSAPFGQLRLSAKVEGLCEQSPYEEVRF